MKTSDKKVIIEWMGWRLCVDSNMIFNEKGDFIFLLDDFNPDADIRCWRNMLKYIEKKRMMKKFLSNLKVHPLRASETKLTKALLKTIKG